MSEQFGNASNALKVDKYPCRVCGAAPGIPCLVRDGRGLWSGTGVQSVIYQLHSKSGT